MAWVGAAATNAVLAGTGAKITRATFAAANGLAARIGVANVAAADTGAFTTDQTPPANYTALPVTFGKTGGLWVAADAGLFNVTVIDRNAVLLGGIGQTSQVHHISTVFNAGDIEFIFHNNGAQIGGDLEITIHYLGF